MDLLTGIRRARAHRSYSDRDVSDDDVEFLVEYAREAGSGHNRQPWTFVAMRDRERLTEFASFGGYTTPLRRAPVGLVVVVDRNESNRRTEHNIFDCGRAVQNLQLAAHERGMGMVPQGISERDRAAEFLEIPASKRVLIALALAYPADDPDETIEGVPVEEELDTLGRYDVEDILHWETYPCSQDS